MKKTLFSIVTVFLFAVIGGRVGSQIAYRWIYNQPGTFQLRDALTQSGDLAAVGAIAGLITLDLFSGAMARHNRKAKRQWLLDQTGRADLTEDQRVAIATLLQELGDKK